MITCTDLDNGVLVPSSGSKLALCVVTKGENAYLQGAYIRAHCTDTYGSYLKDVIALELYAENDYTSTPATRPLALKVTSGFCDIPGVVLAGRVSADGGISYRFGKKSSPFTVSRSGGNNSYEYTITHGLTLGTNYVVIVTPFITGNWKKCHAIVTNVATNSFSVRIVDSGTENDGEAQPFMFAVIGNNYLSNPIS